MTKPPVVEQTRRFRIARMCLMAPRLLPHLFILIFSRKNLIIKADLVRWAEQLYMAEPRTTPSFVWVMIELMTLLPEYRNVFYLRCGITSAFISWMCPPLATLQIASRDIGPGLFIQHGIATLVSAEKIGANCWINQQVSIGYSNRRDRPTIGDNVKILAGAKVIGAVTIGDNAVVGANSVVVDNVPSDVTVFGVPARVIWTSQRGSGAAGRPLDSATT